MVYETPQRAAEHRKGVEERVLRQTAVSRKNPTARPGDAFGHTTRAREDEQHSKDIVGCKNQRKGTVTVMEMSKTTLGTGPTARTVRRNKPPVLRSSPGDGCKDLSSSFVLPLETLQNKKCRKERRSLRFEFSEANITLFAKSCAAAAVSLSMGSVKNVMAVPQQGRRR